MELLTRCGSSVLQSPLHQIVFRVQWRCIYLYLFFYNLVGYETTRLFWFLIPLILPFISRSFRDAYILGKFLVVGSLIELLRTLSLVTQGTLYSVNSLSHMLDGPPRWNRMLWHNVPRLTSK